MTPAALKIARTRLGLSQAGLGLALSDPDGDSPPVDGRTVRRWEAGDCRIPGPAVVAVNYMLAEIEAA